MELFKGCVGWTGEGSETGKVGDIVGAKVDFQYIIPVLAALFVGWPVIELIILAAVFFNV